MITLREFEILYFNLTSEQYKQITELKTIEKPDSERIAEINKTIIEIVPYLSKTIKEIYNNNKLYESEKYYLSKFWIIINETQKALKFNKDIQDKLYKIKKDYSYIKDNKQRNDQKSLDRKIESEKKMFRESYIYKDCEWSNIVAFFGIIKARVQNSMQLKDKYIEYMLLTDIIKLNYMILTNDIN